MTGPRPFRGVWDFSEVCEDECVHLALGPMWELVRMSLIPSSGLTHLLTHQRPTASCLHHTEIRPNFVLLFAECELARVSSITQHAHLHKTHFVNCAQSILAHNWQIYGVFKIQGLVNRVRDSLSIIWCSQCLTRSERLFSIPIFGPTQARHKIRILPLNLRNLARLSPAMRAACQKGLIWIAPSVVARARFAL